LNKQCLVLILWRTFLKTFKGVFVVVQLGIIGVLGLLLVPIAFSGVGWIITKLFPLTLFQATIVSIACAGILVFIFIAAMFSRQLELILRKDDWQDDYDDEDDDEKEEKPQPQPINRVGRNEKCPCGSGRKYKNCCLKKDRNVQPAVSSAKQQESNEEIPF
jgi:hypothetical protein